MICLYCHKEFDKLLRGACASCAINRASVHAEFGGECYQKYWFIANDGHAYNELIHGGMGSRLSAEDWLNPVVREMLEAEDRMA